MTTIRPIYELDSKRGKLLHENLTAVHEELVTLNAESSTPSFIARYDGWKVRLDTSETGELSAASMSRFGQESHSFIRTGDTTWGVADSIHLFEDAHFYNLGNLAMQEDLHWEVSNPIDPR
jgi:hypothetical protein